MARPYCFVTKGGRAVAASTMDAFSMQDKSKKLLDPFEGQYSTNGLIEPLYPFASLALLSEINTYHYRCCRTKARDTAGLGWSIVPVSKEINVENKQKLEYFFDHLPTPINITLDKMMMDFESIAQGTIELVRENGVPLFMEHIPSYTVRIHKSFKKFAQVRGGKKRWFKAVGLKEDIHLDTGEENNGLSEAEQANELLWFVNYTPRSDYYGLPDIFPAIGAIYGDISRRDYNIAFFGNYGVPAYAVFVTGNFDPGEEVLDEDGKSTGRTELEEAIESHFKDLHSNPHSTLILTVPTKDGEGQVEVKFVPLSVDVKEASFRLYRKDNRDEVLAAHGMDPYRIGLAETGSLGGSTAEEATEIYKRSCIEPRQEMIEMVINKHIVQNGFDIWDYIFKLEDLDSVDESREIELAIKLFANAALTPNKLIQAFGQKFGQDVSDLPEMDMFYLNGIPITNISGNETEQAMLSMQERLLNVAEKHSKSGEWVDVVKAILKRK